MADESATKHSALLQAEALGRDAAGPAEHSREGVGLASARRGSPPKLTFPRDCGRAGQPTELPKVVASGNRLAGSVRPPLLLLPPPGSDQGEKIL